MGFCCCSNCPALSPDTWWPHVLVYIVLISHGPQSWQGQGSSSISCWAFPNYSITGKVTFFLFSQRKIRNRFSRDWGKESFALCCCDTAPVVFLEQITHVMMTLSAPNGFDVTVAQSRRRRRKNSHPYFILYLLPPFLKQVLKKRRKKKNFDFIKIFPEEEEGGIRWVT